MSTDIKMFVERREGGKWVLAQRPGNGYHGVVEEDRLDPGQHYRLFAMLAGVRDRDGVDPIAECRDLPADASVFVRGRLDRDLRVIDVNHVTHYAVRELLDYDWDSQRVSDEGFVTKAEAERIRKEGGGPTDHWRSNRAEGEFTEAVTWSQTMRQECRYFLEEFLPSLERFGKLDDLRLIMWFD